MGYRSPKKTVFTLNIGDYAPEICALTYPLMRAYARKIGAEFTVIRERKFPDWPVVYEKLQIYELGQENDWNFFIDGDALVHPEMFDVTEHLEKNTVCHNGTDMATIRWRYDQYFRRDGRHIGSCNWFTVGSDWCFNMWRPLDDLTLEEASQNISITVGERNSGLCSTEHLIDDYTLSRNIARFGLKVETVASICAKLGWRGPGGQAISPFLFHKYTISDEQKMEEMLVLLSTPIGQPSPVGAGWGVLTPEAANRHREEWRRRARQGPNEAPKQGGIALIGSSGAVSAQSPVVPGSHIQGWMGVREMRWLHETARGMDSVVEIGSWKGRSTFALCSSGCAHVYAVDHFLGSSEHQVKFDFAGGWTPFAEFRDNILACFKNVTLKRMSSAEAAKDFAEGSVDMVVLDGAREFESVMEDLAMWAPKARQSVACHTAGQESVKRAFELYFGRQPDQVMGDMWVFRR